MTQTSLLYIYNNDKCSSLCLSLSFHVLDLYDPYVGDDAEDANDHPVEEGLVESRHFADREIVGHVKVICARVGGRKTKDTFSELNHQRRKESSCRCLKGH
jgi:hypothetical protein